MRIGRSEEKPAGSAPRQTARMREIQIRGDMIRLGQLLQFAGIADSGAEAKALLVEGVVTVNGEADARRGRQLHRGDEISVGEDTVRIV